MPRHLQGNPSALAGVGEEGRDRLKAFFAETEFAQDILAKLEDQGYAVLPGVFSVEEADAAYSRAWDFVETVNPKVSRSDPSSWWPRSKSEPDPWPYAQRDMMQVHQAGWVFSDLRERFAERVSERLYGTPELHSSKDGFTFQRPTDGDLSRTPNDHFDQSGNFRGLHCVQGSVALTDQEETDGCFLCWPRSHQLHDKLISADNTCDFIILKDKQKEVLWKNGIRPLRVPVKRGDVILWRSDLCHCGAPPLGARPGFRAVVYICCLPAKLTPEAVYREKIRAYRELKTGSHWPSREEWFEPRNRGLDIQPFFKVPPELTLRQKQLYGLVRYDEAESDDRAEGSGPDEGVEEAPAEESAKTARRWRR